MFSFPFFFLKADIETLEAQVHEKNNSQASLQSFSEEGKVCEGFLSSSSRSNRGRNEARQLVKNFILYEIFIHNITNIHDTTIG